ncbi:MAG TPA: glycosyltransferase family 9 protein [Flavobacterium sp.]|nr:glycosyltransferase family 9 protein [Flavobacterium sp.]
MKQILFLHDTNLSLLRGAELTIQQLISLGKKKGFIVLSNLLRDFDEAKLQISASDLVIVNSTSRCAFEKDLLKFLIEGTTTYVKAEYDYNFCARRNILCTVDRNYRLCCNTDKFHLFRDLFAKSALNIFQSPKHYEAHVEFYGEAVKHYLIMPPTVDVDALQVSEIKDDSTIPFFGDLSMLKGGNEYIEFAEQHPHVNFEVYGLNKLDRAIPANVRFNEPLPNHEVMKILGRTKTMFCKPFWPEPSGRLAAEAFLSGCEIISNDRVGTFSFDFYPNDIARAKFEMQQAPKDFWDACEVILNSDKQGKPSLGKVLVYKSYGGLGDIFFCIPALHALRKVADEVSFAVAPRLVNFFTKHLKNITVVDETVARTDESRYDKVIELGNYPAFRGYDLPHALRYPTHKRVKQHAIAHYVDAVAKFHIDADVNDKRFPYFDREPNFESPYYTMHPGAGFLLKIWPTENYAQVITAIHKVYPMLRCKIIMGPEDPNPLNFIDGQVDYVDFVTGGMDDVGDAMAGALFHIGNDAGITHVAGAFNVPTVGIYGPTGPGSWGSFAEKSEIIWGKMGNCGLRCNYDVILNCASRVCLSSTTANKVIAALYKLLQRAYPEQVQQMMVNPNLKVDITKDDCLLDLEGNEFLINFTDEPTRHQVCNILTGDFRKADVGDIATFTLFLKEQNIVFSVPDFNRSYAENQV